MVSEDIVHGLGCMAESVHHYAIGGGSMQRLRRNGHDELTVAEPKRPPAELAPKGDAGYRCHTSTEWSDF